MKNIMFCSQVENRRFIAL